MEKLQVLYRHISPLVFTESSENALSIKINRPKALNAFNYEILASISVLVQSSHSKPVIFASTLSKSFCSGGDVTDTIENDKATIEFYRTEITTFYLISRLPKTLVIMQGITIGAGNGLAMACKFRVGTNSTKFSMPENSIGHVPDTGASYFLTHLPNKAIGLYLMLTGKMITGNDCYWAGIVTHFISDDKINEFYAECLKTGLFENALAKFASVPPVNESELIRNLPEIEEIFAGVENIEIILQRLTSKNTKFCEDTFQTICGLCPLSVKVAMKSFILGMNKGYKECLEQDFRIEAQLCYRRSYNYTTAITQKFIKKVKGPVPWYPASLAQVTDEMVDVVLRNPEGPHLDLSLI